MRQIITGYVGATLLWIYYKIKGQKITYHQIMNEVNPESGFKKYYYKAYYTGFIFLMLLILVLSTLSGLNPKIYNPNK
ncbi:hypothetical protein [Kordia periserrulae]|uniref:hypothetical protein n=1 Tax=Kordia periserrulae TaxID=701523 RepID=UPI0011B1F6D1|nr:hypothetical protein [Kordia periserrulae]